MAGLLGPDFFVNRWDLFRNGVLFVSLVSGERKRDRVIERGRNRL